MLNFAELHIKPEKLAQCRFITKADLMIAGIACDHHRWGRH
jgi:hypothetical protein